MTDPYAPQQPVPPVPQQPPLPPQPVYYAPGTPVYMAPVVAPPTNALSVVSLVAGIAAWVIFPVIGAIVAVVTGHLAIGQIRRSREGGRGMAVAGVILGWVQLGVVALVIIVWAVIALIAIGTFAGSGGLDS